MNIEIIQKQDRELLNEHAKSSYNFTWISRYEWLMAIIFLIIGISIILFFERIKAAGYIWIGIGGWELIKYPQRVNRWVDKKVTEKIFNKNIKFKLQDDSLNISYGDLNKNYSYTDMRGCMISNTGLLFKITYSEYYYISFKSIDNNISKRELIDFLKSRFNKNNIRIKNNLI